MKMLLPLMLALAMPIALTGCDRTVAETTHTTSDSRGNVKQETKTVTEDAGGNVTVTQEKTQKSVNNQ